ncbi:hypothetical protein BH721_12940 [Clostridium baratii]|uniref:radical SAM/SPASM domain-containing protein n=1 Tax=Clostridium baratii TaxID=1561 RepID=UPI0009A2D492|nr:radical SAM protein [Clostridium baratii]OPF52175.1 hypothetical protein A1M12_13350 [Clostridium baratii]OPF55034.1 hypothetical protein BH724_13120 [Clostridium baratii]OPF57227.1 hypothetical protein BH721_12940 [Clostridium baratii]OPF61029.1 hypothetical protein BH725_00355 [Clostridium baratii]
MFKKSNYNINLGMSSKKHLLYNSFSGAFIALNNESKEIYENIEKISDINTLNNKYKVYVNNLKENNFIIDKNLDEYKVIKVLGEKLKYDSRSLILTIAPTMNCNMECPYCYEKKENKTMNQDTIDDILKFIKKKFTDKNYCELKINWYGGEPLIAINIIQKLSDQVISLCKEYDVKYSASIVTNGTLLTKNICNILKYECNVEALQITLDGAPKTNNSRRKLKNGEDSFDQIINSIQLAAESNFFINVRVNIDKTNLNDIDAIIDIMKENKFLTNTNIHLYFAPVIASTDQCFSFMSNCYSMMEFAEIDEVVLEKLYNAGVKPNFPISNFIGCGAVCDNTFVIDPDGDLYRCWDDVGVKERNIGNLKKGVKFNNIFFEWLGLDIDKKCVDCNKLPICHGGCPYLRIKNHNTECHYKSISFKKSLRLLYDDFLKQNK